MPPPADERLWYGDAASQFVDFRRAVGPVRGLAIMLHGGFWRARYDLVHAGHLCAALAEAGWSSANVEYRRVGEPGGGWPGTFEDVKRAVYFAREWAGGQARAVVLGHSAGGHLALWVAGEVPDLTCVIGLAPVASLDQALSENATSEFLGGGPEEVPERYAYADPARETTVPRILIHGGADDTVPICLSREYAAPARLIEIPGADHFSVIDPLAPAFEVVMATLGAQLHRP